MSCEHDINKTEHDVIIDRKKRNLVYPEVIRGVCRKCGQSCSYIKLNGKFLEN